MAEEASQWVALCWLVEEQKGPGFSHRKHSLHYNAPNDVHYQLLLGTIRFYVVQILFEFEL